MQLRSEHGDGRRARAAKKRCLLEPLIELFCLHNVKTLNEWERSILFTNVNTPRNQFARTTFGKGFGTVTSLGHENVGSEYTAFKDPIGASSACAVGEIVPATTTARAQAKTCIVDLLVTLLFMLREY